jgi:peptide deformylase
MMQPLSIAQFGNPVLRAKAQFLTMAEIKSPETQQLIKGMRDLLLDKKLGIGLAAPQVGESIALAVIAIRPSQTRPHAKPYDLVVINPKIVEYENTLKPMWEGCISSGKGKANLFAQVPRHTSIRLMYVDETGRKHNRWFRGLPAHVLQHEVDHLNAVLFVDRVKDTASYMTHKEYRKLVRAKLRMK